jgi:3-methyladenine DNA glycosylase AlkC
MSELRFKKDNPKMINLKDIYSTSYYDRLADTLQKTLPAFEREQFIAAIFTPDFVNKELKERMRHTTLVLHRFMPDDFTVAAPVLCSAIAEFDKISSDNEKLASVIFPDYVEVYGLEHFQHSVEAFEWITQYVSCEFAVRPFIIRYFEPMMRQMQKWSLHTNAHVRRLASEGSRPRLPWAMAIPALKQNPEPILPVLENLKNDPSESVRRSVANNLNDISKDNPHVVLAIAKKWQGFNPQTDAVRKHACRTLLKQGHTEILDYLNENSRLNPLPHVFSIRGCTNFLSLSMARNNMQFILN